MGDFYPTHADMNEAQQPGRLVNSDGLYQKYIVRRIDGRDAPGEKHDGCRYYVLDLDHDQHAIAAARAYADSCEAEFPFLARDLRMEADRADGLGAGGGRPEDTT
jgi:hypothetical protein